MNYYVIAARMSNGALREASLPTLWTKTTGVSKYIRAASNDEASDEMDRLYDLYMGKEGSKKFTLFGLKPIVVVWNNGPPMPENWNKWVYERASKYGLDVQMPPVVIKTVSSPAEAAKDLRQLIRRVLAYDSPGGTKAQLYNEYVERVKHAQRRTDTARADLREEIPSRRAKATDNQERILYSHLLRERLITSELLTRIKQLENNSPSGGSPQKHLQRMQELIQCLPTAELPVGVAENTLRAIVAILRAHNYTIGNIVPKDGPIGDDSKVQEIVAKEIASSADYDEGVEEEVYEEESEPNEEESEPVIHHEDEVFNVGDRVIVNYNREAREAAGFLDHITDSVIDNQPGEITDDKSSHHDLPFKVRLDNASFTYSWWLPLESLQHEIAQEEVEEEEEVKDLVF